jgi:hypothetical protein
MAKHTAIAGGCGHEHTIQVFGKSADRTRKIEWFETEGLCGECYKAEMAKQEQTKATLPVSKSEIVEVMRARKISPPEILALVGMELAEAEADPDEFVTRAGRELGLR